MIELLIHMIMFFIIIYRVGQRRFILMNIQNTEFTLVLFIIVLFSIRTTQNLLLPHPVQLLVHKHLSHVLPSAHGHVYHTIS